MTAKPTKLTSSVWVLIATNLLPLVGVALWDWRIFDIVAFYWAENIVIGILNIARLIKCGEPGKRKDKFILVPFFTIHYGGFCAGHGVFVFMMFGKGASVLDFFGDPYVAIGILGLFASHTYSFVVNYLRGREYERATVDTLLFQPYSRIIVLHAAVIFGGFAVMALGSPVVLLLILIAGKIVLDVKLHQKEHAKLQVIVEIPDPEEEPVRKKRRRKRRRRRRRRG